VDQDLSALADGTAPVEAASRRLTDSLDYMSRVAAALAGEPNGLGIAPVPPSAAGALRLLTTVFQNEQSQVRGVIELGDRLEQMQSARNALAQSGTALYAGLAEASRGGAAIVAWLASPWLPLGFISVTLLALAYAALLQRSLANLRRAADQQSRQNDRNQQAILRLLDELSSLADGDLTVQATVTEDITGAIADSINYAVEALRELVTTIHASAIKLDQATRQTQALSNHLAKASAAQSKQIAAASESISAMAASTEEVSGNAERSSDVARHSVDIAHKGGDAVRRTIDGMNAIRENIQETSKRIKRLGESSQEIGNIVELINDIAEQTNILALNASIQASMAGEAGRGFAVVADEVQRLAERAANSTRQIEVLVRAIQADTNEAVVSMERTTTDVVGGALLAENAGAALEEIEQVSNQIASLVQNISASSRQQAGVSQSISRNMQVLREISSQTAESTTATSASIGKLAELAAQLRQSVAGFRLPEVPVGDSSGEYPVLPAENGSATPSGRPRRVSGLTG
jgi:twitching motility protein PilJ